MHELGIAYHVAETIEELGKENELEQVASVTLEVGEVSGVIFSYLSDVWPWVCRKSALLKDSELLCEEIHAITICLDCGKTYDTVPQGRQCPHCGSWHTELVTGNEVRIKSVEAC